MSVSTEALLRHLLNRVNVVTAWHRHQGKISPDTLWKLSERQIEVEAAMPAAEALHAAHLAEIKAAREMRAAMEQCYGNMKIYRMIGVSVPKYDAARAKSEALENPT